MCGAHATDSLLHSLASARRRRILEILRAKEGPVSEAELAVLIARGPSQDRSDEGSDRIRTELHHVHLPKLARSGLIEWDRDRRVVSGCKGRQPGERLLEILRRIEPTGDGGGARFGEWLACPTCGGKAGVRIGAYTGEMTLTCRHCEHSERFSAECLAGETLAHERSQRERELEASNEQLEQFAYAASHDLQEPLRMVSSYLQLIDRRYGDALDEDGREFLAFAVDGAERMRLMIDGLLAYSRVERQGYPFEPVDLESVVTDVRKNLELRIEETRTEVSVAELPRVEGDEAQLRRLFQNLLQNAIAYSDDSPSTVYVSAERAGPKWVIAVRDEGVGIDPADQDRIFELFQRLHSYHEKPGTGLGLAICQRIVERHGGEIWVESEPGTGSTFSFTLPALPAE
jgi:two-component sensor histidine kinase